MRQLYMGRGREGCSLLLDEVVEQFGYSRKHAFKLLGAKSGRGRDWSSQGLPSKYGAGQSGTLWRESARELDLERDIIRIFTVGGRATARRGIKDWRASWKRRGRWQGSAI